jgi:hypothetical protein
MNEQPDCLTCYQPSQQVRDIPQWLAGAAGMLRPGGEISIRDVVLPGSRLRGKKAELQRETGRYLNTLLRFAGQGNNPYLSQSQWQDALQKAGLEVVYERVTAVPHSFHTSAVPLSPPDRLRLRTLLLQAPVPALNYLTLQITGDRITFHLQEMVIIAVRSSDFSR